MTDIIENYADLSHGPPWRDRVWGHGVVNLKDGLDNRLLAGLESSLRWLAVNDLDLFRAYASAFRLSEYATVQNLLLRSYAAGGKEFADEAIEYLLEDPSKRFSIGCISTSSVDAVEQLLGAVTPFCSSEHFSSLEQAILDYYPEWERSMGGRQWWGVSQFRLLVRLEPSRLSERSIRRLKELQRKFDNPGSLEPSSMEWARVVSPIPESAARKMNDEEWLGAIKRYSSESSSGGPGKFLVGGAYELSQLLQAQTKENPARFANLIHRIPDDSNLAYFQAILRGLAGSEIDLETLVSACLRCHKDSRTSARPLGDETA